jgi:hypothetical protein
MMAAMADYFLLLAAADFEARARPALAECWRRRTFEPARALCAGLLPAARAYAERYHTGPEPPLLAAVADGLPFDRGRWRAVVGEVLLFQAAEIPEIQTAEEALARLLDPVLVRQAHRGSRDLTFGAAVYRPDHAGYNDRADVARLAAALSAARPETWSATQLSGEDAEEELEYVREWFPALADLYRRAQQRGQVVVIESIW